MISAFVSAMSALSKAFTDAAVPTGIKTGVFTTPRSVIILPVPSGFLVNLNGIKLYKWTRSLRSRLLARLRPRLDAVASPAGSRPAQLPFISFSTREININGAEGGTRTHYLRFTIPSLYQLSYFGDRTYFT